MEHPALLTTKEAADLLHLSEKTLIKWRRLRKGPNYSRLGPHTVRYDKVRLDAWLMTLLGCCPARTDALRIDC